LKRDKAAAVPVDRNLNKYSSPIQPKLKDAHLLCMPFFEIDYFFRQSSYKNTRAITRLRIVQVAESKQLGLYKVKGLPENRQPLNLSWIFSVTLN
jgi:hypothetical protein